MFAAKPEIIAVSESRFNVGSEKINLVCNPASGLTTTKRADGNSKGVIFSPMPSQLQITIYSVAVNVKLGDKMKTCVGSGQGVSKISKRCT